MLDLLKKIAELISLSQEEILNMNRGHTDEYLATTLDDDDAFYLL